MPRKSSKPTSSTLLPAGQGQAALLPSAAETVARIRETLLQARRAALSAVNAAMVGAYWEIGREIVEEEQRGQARADYGQKLLETLSAQLTGEFGKGFDVSNLRNMRAFYGAFPIRDALRPELSWTHYRHISRVGDAQARAFYEVEAVRSRWSTRDLERQIASLLYERLALSREPEGVRVLAERGAEAFEPSDLVRDPFVLEFTGLPERAGWQESDLEAVLVDKLQEFLLEMGSDFFFVARQKRLTIDGDHFYIDLVLYHRALRCFVLIDLKVGKLSHADIGQMLLYTGYYEREEVREDENPPIGLILCTDKNEAVVRYTLSGNAQQVFASRYQLHLPSEDDLRRELERERDALLDAGWTVEGTGDEAPGEVDGP